MLYTTTRNNVDTYTSQRVLTLKRGPDGGLFVPFRLPIFSEEEIQALGNKSFNTRLAEMLNLLFGTHLTAYDIDFSVGRHSVRLRQLGQRLFLGECWHNTDWQFSRIVKDLSQLMLVGKDAQPEMEGWVQTGIRIAVLFGIFGELIREGYAGPEKPVDISVVSGNFSAPMAAWYARGMGLPVGNIVCCCNENGALWDFICHGQLRTDGIAVKTIIPEADILVPEALEQLIALYGGPGEVERYVECLREGNTYYADDSILSRMRRGIYVTVSSEQRIVSTVSSSFSVHRYLLAPSSALAYAGLQDYRSRTGESRTALIMTDKSPGLNRELTASIIGISQKELEQYL